MQLLADGFYEVGKLGDDGCDKRKPYPHPNGHYQFVESDEPAVFGTPDGACHGGYKVTKTHCSQRHKAIVDALAVGPVLYGVENGRRNKDHEDESYEEKSNYPDSANDNWVSLSFGLSEEGAQRCLEVVGHDSADRCEEGEGQRDPNEGVEDEEYLPGTCAWSYGTITCGNERGGRCAWEG